MKEEDELRLRVTAAQDRSWEAGYTCGQFNLADTPPDDTEWPSHWRMGYVAAKEDLAKYTKANA